MPSADSPQESSPAPPIPASNSSTSKTISINLGVSKSNKPKPATATPSSTIINPRKRPHSSLNDDSDSETEAHPQRSPQLVSAFNHSAGGAISVNGGEKAKVPLVIQGLKNRDWREESRRKRGKKNLLPAEVQAQRSSVVNGQGKGEGDVERDEVSQRSGLQFVASVRKEEKDGDGDVEMVNGGAEERGKPKTADEEALKALMGDGARKSTLVVPAVPQGDDEDFRNGIAGMNEDDHFRSDVASRPDSASLDDYARVPVEEFGLGMLRGMGWKEGEVVGKRKDQITKARVVERRPALLGIGAKEVPGGVGEELGAWGKVTRGKNNNKKMDKTYNPVLLKNSKTGEMLTEEELQAKKERQREEEREWRERRDRNLAMDEERKSERKRRERERSYEDGVSRSRREERSGSSDSRHHSSRRERSRSSDRRRGSSRKDRSSSRERRHHSRRRDNDDDDRREKERRRREKYGRDDSTSSRHSHRSREEYDDTRRRRHEVY
ncbi:MAG: hypothetical protein Q9225_000123 [Loekoesia sp. 1 TL-2023]